MGHIEELLQRALEVPTDSPDSDLALFAQIRADASSDDVPPLLKAMKSDRANFWIREMLAEPVCTLGGPRVLPELLEAFRANEMEGHDNDSFTLFLVEMVEEEPAASAEALRAVIKHGDEHVRPVAAWLLGYCA